MRSASIGFAILAVAFFGVAAYLTVAQARQDLPPGEALALDQEEYDLGELTCEVHKLISFRLTNRSSRPVRVVGLPKLCGNTICFYPEPKEQFVLAPGDHVALNYEAAPFGEGPFRVELTIPYEDGGLQGLQWSVYGTCVASKESPDEKPSSR